MMSDVKINKNLQDQYDGYYNDKNEEWRVICAKEKGDNILKMAKGYNFSNVLEYGSGDEVYWNILIKIQILKIYMESKFQKAVLNP